MRSGMKGREEQEETKEERSVGEMTYLLPLSRHAPHKFSRKGRRNGRE